MKTVTVMGASTCIVAVIARSPRQVCESKFALKQRSNPSFQWRDGLLRSQ
jgi:hypothetical protein